MDPISVPELHARILDAVRAGRHALVLNVNVHALNLCYRDPVLRSFFNAAPVVFCDGAGVMLAACLLGRRIPERITYADWVWQLAAFAESQGISLFFLGAWPGVADKAATRLRARHPNLKIVGVHHGYFDHDPDAPENEAVLKEINSSRSDVLLVGFGMPLQERWLMQNWERIDACRLYLLVVSADRIKVLYVALGSGEAPSTLLGNVLRHSKPCSVDPPAKNVRLSDAE